MRLADVKFLAFGPYYSNPVPVGVCNKPEMVHRSGEDVKAKDYDLS